MFTVTATGTIGLESALRGLPVVSGAPMPWTVLGNVAHIPLPEDLVGFVQSSGWEALHESPQRTADWFAQEYVRNSWPGLVLDPPRVPAVLERENIERVGAAFAEAAQSLGAAPAQVG